VHGDAELSDEYHALRVSAVYDEDGGDPAAGGVRAEEWFARKKRALRRRRAPKNER